MNNSEFVSYLNNHKACKGAISWVGKKTSKKAWDTCRRPDWMKFLLDVAKVKLPAEYQAKKALLDAEYLAKRAPILAEYRAEYEAKQADLIRELIPTCPV
jgi:hypothetical protein